MLSNPPRKSAFAIPSAREMDLASESLCVFLDDPTFFNLLWAAPIILAAGILASLEVESLFLVLGLVCAISVIAVRLGVSLLVSAIGVVVREIV